MQNITAHSYLTMDLYNTCTYEHKNCIYNNLSYNVILHNYTVGLRSNEYTISVRGDHILNQLISIKFNIFISNKIELL